MFLSKILTNVKSRYWSIELKMINVVWIIKKIYYLIESSRNQLTIIFTNHSTLTEIIRQTSLSTFNIDELNLRLVRASQYLSILLINIKIKSEKFYIISNALSRLFSIMNIDQSLIDEENVLEDLQYDLDAMFIQSINECNTLLFDVRSKYISEYLDICFEQKETLIDMTNEYRNFLQTSYEKDSQWSKLMQKLEFREHLENTSNDRNFILRNNLIYYVSKEKISRLCVSWSMKKDIY
jgi:hypothetical protein